MVIFHSYVSLPEGSLFSDISGSEVGKVWIWKVSLLLKKTEPNLTCGFVFVADTRCGYGSKSRAPENWRVSTEDSDQLVTPKKHLKTPFLGRHRHVPPGMILGGLLAGWLGNPILLSSSFHQGFNILNIFFCIWALKVQCFSICWYISSYIILHHPTSSYIILHHPTSSYIILLDHPASRDTFSSLVPLKIPVSHPLVYRFVASCSCYRLS